MTLPHSPIYGRELFIDVFLEHRAYRAGYPEVAAWYGARYRAFVGAFGHDLEIMPRVPRGNPPSWWVPASTRETPGIAWPDDTTRLSQQLFRLFGATVEGYIGLHPAFPIHVDGRGHTIVPYLGRYGGRTTDSIRALKRTYRELIDDLVGHLWNIKSQAHVTGDQLRRYGYDPDAPQPGAEGDE